ncbi:MAG: sulfite exporter TauE/SafE family protein, partial [Deltaproteobacteria bacterium]|nr:sulfite exporter TauE/SafE family protein [Deltaproteobacteria bacterium]
MPLLVLCGLPGNLANGSNRVGVLLQNVTAVWSFRAQGVSELRRTIPVLAPLLLGSLIGAGAVSQLSDALFERAFGAVMLLLLVPTFVWQRAEPSSSGTPWSRGTTSGVFFLIGIYGGAFQAGVGLLLLLALARSGLDLVRASALKVAVVGMLTAVSLPVFIANGQVAWLPAACSRPRCSACTDSGAGRPATYPRKLWIRASHPFMLETSGEPGTPSVVGTRLGASGRGLEQH